MSVNSSIFFQIISNVAIFILGPSILARALYIYIQEIGSNKKNIELQNNQILDSKTIIYTVLFCFLMLSLYILNLKSPYSELFPIAYVFSLFGFIFAMPSAQYSDYSFQTNQMNHLNLIKQLIINLFSRDLLNNCLYAMPFIIISLIVTNLVGLFIFRNSFMVGPWLASSCVLICAIQIYDKSIWNEGRLGSNFFYIFLPLLLLLIKTWYVAEIMDNPVIDLEKIPYVVRWIFKGSLSQAPYIDLIIEMISKLRNNLAIFSVSIILIFIFPIHTFVLKTHTTSRILLVSSGLSLAGMIELSPQVTFVKIAVGVISLIFCILNFILSDNGGIRPLDFRRDIVSIVTKISEEVAQSVTQISTDTSTAASLMIQQISANFIDDVKQIVKLTNEARTAIHNKIVSNNLNTISPNDILNQANSISVEILNIMKNHIKVVVSIESQNMAQIFSDIKNECSINIVSEFNKIKNYESQNSNSLSLGTEVRSIIERASHNIAHHCISYIPQIINQAKTEKAVGGLHIQEIQKEINKLTDEFKSNNIEETKIADQKKSNHGIQINGIQTAAQDVRQGATATSQIWNIVLDVSNFISQSAKDLQTLGSSLYQTMKDVVTLFNQADSFMDLMSQAFGGVKTRVGELCFMMTGPITRQLTSVTNYFTSYISAYINSISGVIDYYKDQSVKQMNDTKAEIKELVTQVNKSLLLSLNEVMYSILYRYTDLLCRSIFSILIGMWIGLACLSVRFHNDKSNSKNINIATQNISTVNLSNHRI